jgi:ATP-dependent DNA helicase RecQ
MAWERMGADDPEQAAGQRRQVRTMFDFADGAGCRHRRVCAHFGEAIERCQDACDDCTGDDPLARLPPAPRARRAPAVRKGASRAKGSKRPTLEAEADVELFERLREWRAALAREEAVPAFVILSDATLAEIALARPRTSEALLEVSGIGPRKLEAFGDAVLRLVRKS